MTPGPTPRSIGTPTPPPGDRFGIGELTANTPLWNRQLPFLLLVAGTLLLALAFSPLLRGVLWPIFWGSPFYLNPVITLALILYVGLGLVTTSSPNDQGWPFFMGLIGLWVFIIGFEFSIVQWLELQLGVRTIAARVHPILFVGCAAAIGAAILLHANQLARRLQTDLRQRGLDEEELERLEEESGRDARTIILNLVVLAGIASVVLWIADFLLGGTRLGLDVLGILAGLLIVSVILAYSYSILKQGPATSPDGGNGPSPAPPGDPTKPGTSPATRPGPNNPQSTQQQTTQQPTTQQPDPQTRQEPSRSTTPEQDDAPGVTWRKV